jgi:ferredoxin-NADP reductase
MTVKFERREELAPGIWQYFFRPERRLDFIPGQYADFHFLHPLSDARGQSRVFTLTSLPGDELVSFVVKFIAPLSSYKQALQALQPGDTLRIDDAMGDLVLPKSPEIPLVFVAGGIGVASYTSMFMQLLSTREERPIFFFYALRSRREQIFRELYDGYPLQLKQIILAPNRLSAQEIKDTTPPDAFIYLSGSQKFVEGLRIELAALGTPHEQIVFDYYDGYAEL